MKTIETDIQIRFADIDSLGHVNNVNLQHYFDLGKMDFYRRAIGIVGVLSDKTGIFPITAGTQTDYFGQTHPEENIYVETTLEKVGNKSMTFAQRIVSRATGEVKAASRSAMVAFDFAAQVSVPVPEEWRESVQG
jgi:YbgC/YbaW family acyl-CoA thioester hydrolase